MAVHYTTTIEYGNETIADIRKRLTQNAGSAKSKATIFAHLIAEFRALLGGTLKGRGFVRTQAASACAAQTVTVDYTLAVAATDTITIGGTALSAVAAVTTESQFLIGASNAAYVANVVACINAHSVISKYARAYVVSSTVFRITCKLPGPLGNFVLLAEAGNGFTLTGSALTGGASDANYGYSFGYSPST